MTPEYLNVGGLTLGIVNFTIVLVNCLENELSHPVIRGQTKNMVRPPPQTITRTLPISALTISLAIANNEECHFKF